MLISVFGTLKSIYWIRNRHRLWTV